MSFVGTPYYNKSIETVRMCKKVDGFPNVSSRSIYKYLNGVENTSVALVEEKYSIFNWEEIWKNISFKVINSYDRTTIYKYIHEILPNRYRLYNIKKIPSPNCNHCDREENNMHMLYFCNEIRDLVNWFRKLLMLCLGSTNLSMIKLLVYDTTAMNRKKKNTVSILVTNYICTVWNNRDNPGDKLFLLKKKIMQQHNTSQFVLKEKMSKMFTDVYCNTNQRFLDNID